MQIHELAALGRTPTTGDSLAIDTGSATVKIDYAALATAILDKIGAGSDGVVDIDHGGTNAATAAGALVALGAAASADLADAYSASATYAVGDLCIYNNTLYKCTAAIETAEAWTPAHWTATTLDDVVVKYSDVVNNLISGGTTVPLSAEMGKRLNTKVSVPITANSGFTVTEANFVMANNVVCGSLMVNGNISSGTVVATINDANFRPSQDMIVCGVNNDTDVFCNVMFRVNGNIQAYGSATHVRIMAVYPARNRDD